MRVVGDDGFGPANDERVVGWRKLHVVVVDATVPVLGARALHEAFGGLDGTDGTDGREDEIRKFGQEVRSPSVLVIGHRQLLMFQIELSDRSGHTVAWTTVLARTSPRDVDTVMYPS